MEIKLSSLVLLREFLDSKGAEKLGAKQVELLQKILDTLNGVDISIDQLTALVAGTDALSLQVGQNTYGRVAPMNIKRARAFTAPPKAAATNEGWSDHRQTKSLTENWREFLGELTGPQKARQVNTDRHNVGGSNVGGTIKAFVKAADAPINQYVPFLKKIVNNPGFKAIATAGLTDADGPADEQLKIKPGREKVLNLYATQKEIGVGNSLADQMQKPSWGDPRLNALGLRGSPIEMLCKDDRCAILTFGPDDQGRYRILDGHHRWSQIMMMNPEAEVAIDNLQPSGALEGNVEAALKVMQLAIAIKAGKVVTLDFEGENLMDASRDYITNYVLDNISDETLQLMVQAKKIPQPKKELAAKYIAGNLDAIQQRKGLDHLERGKVMPQAADSGTKQADVNAALASGAVNFDDPQVSDVSRKSKQNTRSGIRGSTRARKKQGRMKMRETLLHKMIREEIKKLKIP